MCKSDNCVSKDIIKDWIAYIDKDIEANKKADYIAKEKSGIIEVGYSRIVYSPENVKRMLELILNNENLNKGEPKDEQ